MLVSTWCHETHTKQLPTFIKKTRCHVEQSCFKVHENINYSDDDDSFTYSLLFESLRIEWVKMYLELMLFFSYQNKSLMVDHLKNKNYISTKKKTILVLQFYLRNLIFFFFFFLNCIANYLQFVLNVQTETLQKSDSISFHTTCMQL